MFEWFFDYIEEQLDISESFVPENVSVPVPISNSPPAPPNSPVTQTRRLSPRKRANAFGNSTEATTIFTLDSLLENQVIILKPEITNVIKGIIKNWENSEQTLPDLTIMVRALEQIENHEVK